jgi:DNA-binding transcriptional LysR family regulator
MQHSMISTTLAAVSLRDLALVQAVHRHASFNSAARAMHISPSGLSHQVQKVEQALGAPLFERGGRSIVPTAGGRRLLQQIDAVLAAGEHLQQLARAGAVAFGGELRLGLPASLGPYLLPHLISPFPQHFPGARLVISEGKPRGLLRRLHEGELDAVPGVDPVTLEDRQQVVPRDRVVVGQHHPERLVVRLAVLRISHHLEPWYLTEQLVVAPGELATSPDHARQLCRLDDADRRLDVGEAVVVARLQVLLHDRAMLVVPVEGAHAHPVLAQPS